MMPQSNHYYIALLWEAIDVFVSMFLIKCGLKQVTIEERYELIRRRDFVQEMIKGMK